MAAITLTLGAGVANGQTVAELLLVAHLSAVIDPAISLPRGAYQVTNGAYATDLARQLGLKAQPGSLTLYVATGIIGKLADEFAGNLATSFAANGYLPATDETKTVNGVNARWETFEGEDGRTITLVVIRDKDRTRLLVGLAR